MLAIRMANSSLRSGLCPMTFRRRSPIGIPPKDRHCTERLPRRTIWKIRESEESMKALQKRYNRAKISTLLAEYAILEDRCASSAQKNWRDATIFIASQQQRP
jgi:hypothetical protein